MANYYDYTYAKVTVPGFVSYFEQQEKESKAWREDMGKIIDESYSEYAPAPSPQTDTPPAAAPGQTLYNYTLRSNGRFFHGKHRLYSANGTLTCIQQSQKDWEYFFNNIEVSLTGITFKDEQTRFILCNIDMDEPQIHLVYRMLLMGCHTLLPFHSPKRVRQILYGVHTQQPPNVWIRWWKHCGYYYIL